MTDGALREAAALVRRAERLAVLAHVNPDADAIGAVVGLARGFQSLGKEAVAALSDPVPEYARFLDGADQIASNLPPDGFDAYVFVDSASIDRVGDIYLQDPHRFESAPLLNLDHHRTNPLFGTVNYVDPSASSSSELSYRLLDALGAPMDESIATALLFGIVGDTGSFRNGATTPGSFEVAAHLLRRGARNQEVAFHLFESKRFPAARLWGRVMSTIELDARRRIVFACLSQDMLRAENATVDETEGIAEYLRGVQEADIVMLLKETPEGEVRVSLRSQPSVDVAAIASALGGGGHRQAAGCTLPGPFSVAREILVSTYDKLNPR